MYNQELLGDIIDIDPEGRASRRNGFLYNLLHRRPGRRIRAVEAAILDAEQLAGTQHGQKIEHGLRNTELVSFQLRAEGHAADIAGQVKTLVHVRENGRLATEVLSDINQVDASLDRAKQLVRRHDADPRATEAADIIIHQMMSSLRRRPIR